MSLAMPTRSRIESEFLQLSTAQLEALTAEGIKSGMFVTQNPLDGTRYTLFNKDLPRIDGIIAFGIPKAKLSEGNTNVFQRSARGVIFADVAESANGVTITDIPKAYDEDTFTGGESYKTLLEKQGFTVANHNTAHML